MWNVDEKNPQHERTVKIIRIGISSVLTLVGLYILASQAFPIAESFLKGKVIEKSAELQASPVPGSYKREIGGEFAYWDPGRSYFDNLIDQVGSISGGGRKVYNPVTEEYQDIIIDESYSANMSLTIDTLDIQNVNVASNVESYNEDIYNTVLKDGLAHFRSTPLPGAGGNSFIYGHSAVESYFSGHQNNPEVVFTRLEDIKIGDEVRVQKDGTIYTYTVRKKKVVEPDDFSILAQQNWKETLTLMTCTPIGIGTHRLVVTAELSDG